MKLFDRLFEGPIDIVGDVHGEIDALTGLLVRLGYTPDGRHPDGRRLVFVGDLTDRGPDSVAVLEQVAAMVTAGRAQCIVGNHELNLLRDVPKHGNDWWARPDAPTRLPAVPVTPAAKARLKRWLATLPLALERDDLRVVHACWHAPSIRTLREYDNQSDHDDTRVLALYREYTRRLDAYWRHGEGAAALRDEWRAIKPDLHDPDIVPAFMPVQARMDTEMQMANPLRVLTSGIERPAPQPFWAGGRWRMVERVKWWERYNEPVPVVIGHYWRRYSATPTAYFGKFGPDLFEGIARQHWMGVRDNVYCIDFSAGGRAEQRYAGQPADLCQLAALRVPEWQVVHDGGEQWEIDAPGS